MTLAAEKTAVFRAPETGKPILLSDLPHILPRRDDGAKVDFSTIWAWATAGPPDRRLETTIIAGTRYTTIAAARAFLARR